MLMSCEVCGGVHYPGFGCPVQPLRPLMVPKERLSQACDLLRVALHQGQRATTVAEVAALLDAIEAYLRLVGEERVG